MWCHSTDCPWFVDSGSQGWVSQAEVPLHAGKPAVVGVGGDVANPCSAGQSGGEVTHPFLVVVEAGVDSKLAT